MKWFLYLILFLQSHNSFVNSSTKNLTHFNPNYNYLTYHGGGRFGDRLIAYMHAKWLSYKYNIPMLYIPFAYSDDLILDDIELQYRNHGFNKFYRRTAVLKNSVSAVEEVV
ncbi:MAG: hypothetical protein EBZ47_05820 [Chlamydiae bacterium]|nr:hypothetical protein [Chlamydiota bacterium]